MKTYTLLLLACLPLGVVAFCEASALALEAYSTGTGPGTIDRARAELEKALGESRKVSKLDPGYVAGMLGVAAVPETAATGRGLEAALAEAFGRYGRAEDAVRSFVEAFPAPPAETPPALADYPDLLKFLEDRQRLLRRTNEADLQRKLKEGDLGDALIAEIKRYLNAYRNLADMLLAERARLAASGIWPTREQAQQGSVLVLIVKTRDLVADGDAREKLDNAQKGIKGDSTRRDELALGRFVLVTTAGVANARRRPWVGAEYVTGSLDAFGPQDAFRAFERALEVALEVDAMRGKKLREVIVIWRSDAGPQRTEDTLRAVSRLASVKLIWIAPSGDDPAGVLKDWFGDRAVTVLGRGDATADELANQMFPPP